MKKRMPIMVNADLQKKFKSEVSSLGLSMATVNEWLIKAWLRGDIKYELEYKK